MSLEVTRKSLIVELCKYWGGYVGALSLGELVGAETQDKADKLFTENHKLALAFSVAEKAIDSVFGVREDGPIDEELCSVLRVFTRLHAESEGAGVLCSESLSHIREAGEQLVLASDLLEFKGDGLAN